MTWSIIARDAASGRTGIIVATRFFAVGALVPHIRTGVGAIASQAFMNPYYGANGLALLAGGATAQTAIAKLVEGDEGRANRQVHALDSSGNFAAYTGEACIAWCGHLMGEGYSIAGNMLAGAAVLEETSRSLKANASLPFAQRLIVAMQAGEAAGGDKRGKQSAALLIHDQEDYPLYDLRVDDAAEPLAELARLEEVARQRWLHFRRFMPNRQLSSGLRERGQLEDLIAKSIAEGYR
jgi:uncharacterized Ntn-hydrolase superfamily protein